MQEQFLNPSSTQLISKILPSHLLNAPKRKPSKLVTSKNFQRASLDECPNSLEAQSQQPQDCFFGDNQNCGSTDNNSHDFENNIINAQNNESISNDFSGEVIKASNNKKPRKNYELLSRVHNARSGPWTQAEQIYAMKIIDEFEAGRLPEIPPKWTLRLLLSFKLQCPKMRISKKFGGRCKGKIPYKNYLKNNPTNEVTDMVMMRKLELDFLASIADKSNNINGREGYMPIQPMLSPALQSAIVQATASTMFQESTNSIAISSSSSSSSTSRLPFSQQQPKETELLNGNGSSINTSALADLQYSFSQPVVGIYYNSSSSSSSSTTSMDHIVGFSSASKECNSSNEIDHHGNTTGSLRSSEVSDDYPESKIRKFFNPFIDSFYNDNVPVVHISNITDVLYDT